MQLFGRQNSIGQTKVLADDTQNNPFVDVAKRVASAAEQKWTPKGTMVDRGCTSSLNPLLTDVNSDSSINVFLFVSL